MSRILPSSPHYAFLLQGVALNAKKLDDNAPVEPDDQVHYMKEFENPNPVVKIAELTGASSDFGASGDAMLRIDLQNKCIRNALYWAMSIFNPVYKKSDLKGYLDPGEAWFILQCSFLAIATFAYTVHPFNIVHFS